jgi:hypothetical protein
VSSTSGVRRHLINETMTLLQWLRSNQYRVRAVGYFALGLFLAFIAVWDSSRSPLIRLLALSVAIVAIVGGLRRAIFSRTEDR